MRRIAMIAISIAEAIRNRMPAKVNGGRSVRPTLMNSQVEPQMQQSRSQTRRDFIHYLLYVRLRDWSISFGRFGFGVSIANVPNAALSARAYKKSQRFCQFRTPSLRVLGSKLLTRNPK